MISGGRCAENLATACDRLPLLTAQLQILATANEQRPASSEAAHTTVRMMASGARNLLDAVTALLVAAQAASVKVSFDAVC